jgi:hypothetical protein
MKYETVCIRRQGYSLLHTEGADFAAKVTYHGWEARRGQVYTYEVVSEWLIPIPGYWGE